MVWLPIVVEGLICLLRNSLHNQRKASQKCLGPAGTAVVALVLNIGALCFILSEPICSPRGGEGQIGGRLRPANLQGVGNSRLTLCPFLFCLLFWVKTFSGRGRVPSSFPWSLVPALLWECPGPDSVRNGQNPAPFSTEMAQH